VTEPNFYVGDARRVCKRCGLEQHVTVPHRVTGRDSTPSWRDAYKKELSRQLLWFAMCPECRAFWAGVIRRIETDGKGDQQEVRHDRGDVPADSVMAA
jgi:hypothetical protein